MVHAFLASTLDGDKLVAIRSASHSRSGAASKDESLCPSRKPKPRHSTHNLLTANLLALLSFINRFLSQHQTKHDTDVDEVWTSVLIFFFS